MAERTVGPRGKPVSVYLSYEALEILDKASKTFKVSRSDVLENFIKAFRDELEEAVSQKTNSLLGGT